MRYLQCQNCGDPVYYCEYCGADLKPNVPVCCVEIDGNNCHYCTEECFESFKRENPGIREDGVDPNAAAWIVDDNWRV